ncbi:MAG: hypothetical protein BM555_02325 [Crocinitomix sp. MedPE-SWsnd]|nr:MAG: hypothetical protein BM555_02325 [Crocinitomix sp. MedPE-SWsnd]
MHFGASASHIVGGEIYYDQLGVSQYRVTVKLYRDCLSDGAEYDANLPITVFDGSGNQIDNFTIPFPGSNVLPPAFSNPCVTIPSDICVEEAIYQKTITLPPSANGYTLSYQRCCRGPNVTNLTDPGDQGLTLTIDIPPTIDNNSPRYNNFPPLLLCANTELVFDHSATDPDGDVLEYSLCTPFQGGTSFAPAPNPASAPPYADVVWAGGASATNPFITGTISLDANTGLMIAEPGQPGLFAVGVCVSEYRNGVLIGVNKRDFLFRVMNCEVELEAEITPQNELNTFVSFCQGLTIDFENESWGGENYLWDFGVDGINSDISAEFAPSYTYPGPGTYEVMMIVNPGWPCTDTAIGTYIVNNEIEASFEVPPVQCVIGNSYDFEGEGTFPAVGSTFEWTFDNAVPGTSTDQDPTDIVFQSPGWHNVKFKVMFDQCVTQVSEMVQVAGPPTINFGIADELRCVPYTAEFVNLSQAATPIISLWNLGDGTTSTETHPTHVYDEVGTYTVSLTIWTETGCIDTLTMTRPNLIEVFPRPTAGFVVSPNEQNEYEANFFFEDESFDGVESWYNFGDGTTSSQDTTWHFYNEPGVYHPWQIVYNEHGCSDRAQAQLTVTPIIPIMVPNAFTPNGDSYNGVFQPVLYQDQVYELQIYNRWGELIHKSKEWNANWDGKYQGVLVKDDVYIWKVIYTDFKTEVPVEVQGHVLLMK